MRDEDIFQDLKQLDMQDTISKRELLDVLKKYGRTISPHDLMLATNILREDGKYVQASYREKFLETYIKSYIVRMKDILNTNDDIDGNINKEHFSNTLGDLEKQFHKEQENTSKKSKFPLIYTLTSLFSTFITEQPIHPEGSEFPGSLKVYEENGEFYCPVKESQKDNPNAVCNFCLAKQAPKS